MYLNSEIYIYTYIVGIDHAIRRTVCPVHSVSGLVSCLIRSVGSYIVILLYTSYVHVIKPRRMIWLDANSVLREKLIK